MKIKNKANVILLVDDEPANIRLLNNAVSALGKTYFASNGEEAIKMAHQVKPDLILLDIQMPGMNGYEVCDAIMKDSGLKDAAIIFVTAHGDTEHELKALQYGGVDFLQKPLNPLIIEARAKTHLELKNRQHQLNLTRGTLDNIIHHLPVFVAYWDDELNNVFSNDIKGNWFGIAAKAMLGQQLKDVINQNNILDTTAISVLSTAIDQVMLGKTMGFDLTFNASSSEVVFVSVSLVPTLLEGKFNGFVMLLNDITPMKVLQNDLHQDKELLKVTLNSIGDAVITTDVNGIVNFMNPIASSLTGWRVEDAVDKPIEQIMPLTDSSGHFPMVNPIYIAIKECRIVGMAFNTLLHTRQQKKLEVEDSAAPILDQYGQTQGAIIVFHDVSETRAMALKMSHLANHDSLTNLPNRMLLQDRAERAINTADRNNEKVAMLMIDIDNFKSVNDSVGHKAGDILLKKVANRLLDNSRTVDTVSRQGGDEFIILQPEITKLDQVASCAQRILALFTEPFYVNEKRFDLSCSIGLAVYPDDSMSIDMLHKHSDLAMYRAKELGRGRWHFYADEIGSSVLARHKLEQYLRHAVQEQLFEVYYQAKTDIRNNKLVGMEALLRLKSADGLFISPAEFIPLAEECGQIVPIGNFVMRKACEDAISWQQMGLKRRVSINISPIQFAQDDFYDTVYKLVEELSIDTGLIEFEITEGVLARDIERTRDVLEALQKLGIKISIDDFGTGYSSLLYLKRFPIDILKIDKSFIDDMLNDESDEAIVDTIISLANSLKMQLVAEGVETIEQVNALSAKGCFVMQGYYYCKPMPYQQMCDYLQQNA
ncbi:two-component system response regulator [Shewanella saliphila]|nr:EAL domain-containing protein [Shewanella saliphila]MCL1101322.1 EAL domain-containing protein [Shewanella saliphila]